MECEKPLRLARKIFLAPNTKFWSDSAAMKAFRSLTTSEQLAAHLRGEILRGALGDTMPGIKQLVRALGVNSMAVAEAMKQLEAEGLLAGQGPRRCYRIVGTSKAAPPAMRIAFVPFDPAFKRDALGLEVLRALGEHRHDAFFTGKTLVDLRMDPRRVAGMVGQLRADAWIVTAAERPVLEWFATSGLRAFALFGAWSGLPIAGMSPEHFSATLELTRQLIALGHKRIVYLLHRGQLDLATTRLAPMMLDEMARHGIGTGPYNVPQWQDSPEGFRHLLESMFKHSPPTAMIIEELPHLIATLQFCGQYGIRVPQDLSLACLEWRSELDYCIPPVTQLRWDYSLIVRRIARWADALARGREDLRQGCAKAELVEGGTIGPVPGRK